MDFGYYPKAFDKVCGDVVFATLPSLDAKIAGLPHDAIKDGWYFAQPQRLQDVCGKITSLPYPNAFSVSQRRTTSAIPVHKIQPVSTS